jgi:sulfhydrogenase subunit delta
VAAVYASPEYISTLERSTPISDHVTVDFELQGCPINKHQLLELISSYLNERAPNIQPHSVCIECKRSGNVCVMVAHGTPCLGPVTHAGCGALCPAYDRGCYGCYGPMETANPASLTSWMGRKLEVDPAELVRVYRTFNANAPAFKRESDAVAKEGVRGPKHGGPPDV